MKETGWVCVTFFYFKFSKNDFKTLTTVTNFWGKFFADRYEIKILNKKFASESKQLILIFLSFIKF